MDHLALLVLVLAPLSGDNGCSIGSNGDMMSGAIANGEWRSQSPFRVSGSFGDPMVPIDLLWHH